MKLDGQHLTIGPGNQIFTVRVSTALVFVIFLGAWSFVAFAATLTIYEFYRISGQAMSFPKVAGMECSEFLTFIPVSPLAFKLALRVPLQRRAWIKTSLLYLAGGLIFNLGHIAFRGLTPYGYWDPRHQEWTFAFWDTHAHALRNAWAVSKSMFLTSVVDDVIAAYLPILVVAHACVYYRGLQEHEFHSTHLAEQLANARLQTLRSQLQPHFLFNTLHSISALMLTDVGAADRMMTSLSDLLRMSLEADAVQLTTLSREMEFLGIYLDIEKVRFEERLQVVIDIAPECLDAQVPHLLLQPLVENAVRHGISKLSRNGEIQIVARRTQCGTLEIWVRDNGPGISRASEANSRRGLGLRLTRERLVALYGENQACEFRNASVEGMEVYLRLPFTTSDAAVLELMDVHKLESHDSGRSK